MKRTILQKVARVLREPIFARPCPNIRWRDVVRIEAMGTDAFSPFQIWLTFIYSDGDHAEVAVEMEGYWDIVESLHTKFPSISPTWYKEMSKEPWHVERILYSKDEAMA